MIRLFLAFTALASGACASAGGVPSPFPVPGGASAGAPPAAVRSSSGVSSAGRYALAGTALGLRGVPYRNGGADPSGFDCSGLVVYVFAQHGLSIPRTVAEQFALGVEASGELEPGDLVFFSTIAPGASHVGIAIGGDAFVHAPSSSGHVRVERISSSYWSQRYVGARRVG